MIEICSAEGSWIFQCCPISNLFGGEIEDQGVVRKEEYYLGEFCSVQSPVSLFMYRGDADPLGLQLHFYPCQRVPERTFNVISAIGFLLLSGPSSYCLLS